MKIRIFKTIMAFAVFVAVISSAVVIIAHYNIFEDRILAELSTEAEYIKSFFGEEQASNIQSLNRLGTRNRITLVSDDGTVLFDNYKNIVEMDNHAKRPEIADALVKGRGNSSRFSDTISEKLIYYALRLDDRTILRISTSQKTAFGVVSDSFIPIIVMLTLIVICAIPLSRYAAKTVVAPINNLDLDNPLENNVYPELSPLLLRMQRQKERLSEHLEQIASSRKKFVSVTENMSEALILLDGTGNVLSVNIAAIDIFSIEKEQCIGKYYLSVSRNTEFQNAVDLALSGRKTQTQLSIGNSEYKVLSSPVFSESLITGVVILGYDVTAQSEAERARRDFTSNVTHELKTPITSIRGYAEIIKEGIAKPEDIIIFAGRINDEADRLTKLVDDILKLSNMDASGGSLQKEKLDLYKVASGVISNFKTFASLKNVELELVGVPVRVNFIRRMLEDIIGNLVENALKYNKENGKVIVTVEPANGQVNADGKLATAILTVQDTGIGIPQEQQNKVFERFFRVDTARTNKTGGTGLGLSIVKHSAAANGALLELSSSDTGTIVSCII